MELARPALAGLDMRLQNLDADLAAMPLMPLMPAMPVMPVMPAMPAMPVMPVMPVMPALGTWPSLAAMELDQVGVVAGHDLDMAARDLAMAERDLALSNSHAFGYERDRAVDEARTRTLATVPPEPSAQQQDQADSLYQAARTSLNRGSYESAARLFRTIRDRYARSTYVADSYYWEAYSLYSLYRQTSQMENLRTAVRALDDQKAKYPRATTRGDSDELATRVLGEMAKRGDANAAERIARLAESSGRGAGTGAGAGAGSGTCVAADDEDDVRIAALNALQQMNSDDALPVLRQVLARRDACSTQLRRKALTVVGQKKNAETENILLESARNDPDREVRSTAVQWLGNIGTERSAVALDSIIRTTQDTGLRERAVGALAQHRSPRAGELLRAFVLEGNTPDEVRETAVTWLAQSRRSPQNSEFLRDYYKRTTSRRLKEKIVSALANAGGEENAQFLLTVALDEQETVDTRRTALYRAGQSRQTSFDSLAGLYDRMQNRDMKEVLIMVYAQRRGPEAVDKLMDIAKKEKDRELRNSAIRWLGQSRDPRAAQFLLQLINQ
jgi:HEAT repeat protein